jgi:c-di-GMP-specific phosphodiesterase
LEGAAAASTALGLAGVAAFLWSEADDALSWSGAAEALGLASAATWAELMELFVEADRPQLDRLRANADGGVIVVRLSQPGGRFRRARVRVGWSGDYPRILGGLITPAYGAEGETAEHGRIGFEPALRCAAENLDFEAWYQPIVSLQSGETAGLEALVRWRSEERGVMAPDDFLPMLDELGQTARLGAWMRAEAAAQLGRWRAAGAAAALGYVAVNITAHDLDAADFADNVAALIAAHGLPKGALRLEITEGEVMRDADKAAAILAEAKAAGASLALDDFGSGHASLAWLERFAVDALKIDRYFVRTLPSSTSSETIVASITALAHDLGLVVVAEGVEEAATAERLAKAGCDYGQGFYFAPALQLDEVERWLG